MMQAEPRTPRLFAMPVTRVGRLAAVFLTLHILAMSGRSVIAAIEESTFDLLGPMLLFLILAGVFGLAAGAAAAAIAIFSRGERSILDWLAIALGLLIVFFLMGGLG